MYAMEKITVLMGQTKIGTCVYEKNVHFTSVQMGINVLKKLTSCVMEEWTALGNLNSVILHAIQSNASAPILTEGFHDLIYVMESMIALLTVKMHPMNYIVRAKSVHST